MVVIMVELVTFDVFSVVRCLCEVVVGKEPPAVVSTVLFIGETMIVVDACVVVASVVCLVVDRFFNVVLVFVLELGVVFSDVSVGRVNEGVVDSVVVSVLFSGVDNNGVVVVCDEVCSSFIVVLKGFDELGTYLGVVVVLCCRVVKGDPTSIMVVAVGFVVLCTSSGLVLG